MNCHCCGVPEEQFDDQQEFSNGETIKEFNDKQRTREVIGKTKVFCSIGCVIEKLGLY